MTALDKAARIRNWMLARLKEDFKHVGPVGTTVRAEQATGEKQPSSPASLRVGGGA